MLKARPGLNSRTGTGYPGPQSEAKNAYQKPALRHLAPATKAHSGRCMLQLNKHETCSLTGSVKTMGLVSLPFAHLSNPSVAVLNTKSRVANTRAKTIHLTVPQLSARCMADWGWSHMTERYRPNQPSHTYHYPSSPFPNSLLDKFSLRRSRERSEWTVIDENGKEPLSFMIHHSFSLSISCSSRTPTSRPRLYDWCGDRNGKEMTKESNS